MFVLPGCDTVSYVYDKSKKAILEWVLKRELLAVELLSNLGKHTYLSETSEEKMKRFVQINQEKRSKMIFFGIFSKTSQRVFLIFCQNLLLIELSSRENRSWKKFCSEVISGQRCTEAHYWMILFFTFFTSCSKMIGFSWNFQEIIISWFWDESWCILSVLTKSCLCLPKILLLNDPFPIIWFLALKWWDLDVTFRK